MSDDLSPRREGPISRRTALGLLGGAGLGALAAACSDKLAGTTASPSGAGTAGTGTGGSSTTAPGCVLTQEVTEGPYYLPLHLVRQDITEGKEGVPLQIDLRVVDATTCQPVSGAVVDIWHADALGVYSGVAPLGSSSGGSSSSGSFLRGVQSTGADGAVTFKTVYRGWYMGRTAHIHLKVLLNDQTVHTGQLFFPDSLTATVYRDNEPYESRPEADTTNGADNIFQQAAAAQAILAMTRQGSGYLGTMTMGVRV